MESLANPVGVGAHHKGERPASSVPVRIVPIIDVAWIGGNRSHRDYLAPAVIASMRNIPEQKMIRKLDSGELRLYSRNKDLSTGKRRNPDTFRTRVAADKHEREVQYFKRNG